MRSIAHEMGQRLGCGAHLASLRRTSVAEFDITQAHTLEQIEFQGKGIDVEQPVAVWGGHSCPPISPRPMPSTEPQRLPGIDTFFVHPRELLPQFPAVTADEATAARIRSGRSVNLPELSRARQVKVFAGQTELLAIATRVAGTLFHPKIVFPSE
jgi:tRNA pseudouridine55 synthase